MRSYSITLMGNVNLYVDMFKNWSYLPLSRIIQPIVSTIYYIILLTTDKLKQSSPFSAYKHFEFLCHLSSFCVEKSFIMN